MPHLSYDDIELGEEYGPYYYPLQEHIDHILEATGNQHPWHRGRSPWGPPVAPPSILGNISLSFIDWVAPIPPGTLHTRQDIETQAALRLDRHPMGYGKFIEKFERFGRRHAVFEARFRDETGLLIGHGRTTLAFPEKIETKDDPAEETHPRRKGELEPVTRALTQDKLAAARAEAMIAADHISEILTGVYGKEWFEYATLSLVFPNPVLNGDTLTANGRLKEAPVEGAVVRKVYEVWAENQRGDTVAVGTASSLVRPD